VLEDDSSGTDALGDDSRRAVRGQVAGVAGGVDLTGSEEDDW